MSGANGDARAELADGVRAGETRALARAISLVENGDPAARELVAAALPAHRAARTSSASPGRPASASRASSRRSSPRPRARASTVGVISVDPSSPFTQGALLGDRIRLTEHFLDPGVFIRSMGTRGHAGGLAEATLQALLSSTRPGKDVVFLETVGAGQNEVGVLIDRRHGRARADARLRRLGPGAEGRDHGDPRRDRDQQAATTRSRSRRETDVRQMLALGPTGTPPPIVLTEALRGEGVDELWETIAAHKAGLEAERRARGAPRAATSRPRSTRSPRRARAAIWRMQSRATPSCSGCSTRCGAAGSTR